MPINNRQERLAAVTHFRLTTGKQPVYLHERFTKADYLSPARIGLNTFPGGFY